MDFRPHVNRLFRAAPDRTEELRKNPVTGQRWVNGVDSLEQQKLLACRALEVQHWVALMAPPDAPQFPRSYEEREMLKTSGVDYLMSVFGRSLAYRDYERDGHPDFNMYTCGVLASPLAPDHLINDAQLVKRFPPRRLHALGPGLIWRWPIATIRHASPAQQKNFLLGFPPMDPNEEIPRAAANVPDSYAPWARKFIQLADETIAHATKFAPCKRPPRRWHVHKPNETFCRKIGGHTLWVVASDYGWLIERKKLWSGDEQVLYNILFDAPVLCRNYASAARLAEACYPKPETKYLLAWCDLANMA